MKKIFLIYGHYNDDSFNAAIRDTFITEVKKNGYKVDLINLFEEINFFKDYDVSINVPIILSLFFVPSLFYNMFPFIILLSGIWFFRKI
mgnify:CR=1 FL=1